MYYVGLLSGTSLDSIDAGLWSFSKSHEAELIHKLSCPIETSLRQSLLKLSQQGQCSLIELGSLDRQLGKLFADLTNQLIEQSSVNKSNIMAIGSHGQTLWHQPEGDSPFTMQIGDPNIIAQTTGLTTVADFRRADMALGGQGAPLVPAFHHWLFHSAHADRVIVNIGGIANISILPANHSKILGYDTGPGNGLLDAWAYQHWQKDFDQDGTLAFQGTPCQRLLDKMLDYDFFHRPFPKSTGRETFNLAWLHPFLKEFTLSPEDVLSTLVALTSYSISQAVRQHFSQAEIYVCGGGVHNDAVMASLSHYLGASFKVNNIEALGMSPDWVESACFAWLAKQRIENKTVPLCTVTGSIKNTLLGGIYDHFTEESELKKLA